MGKRIEVKAGYKYGRLTIIKEVEKRAKQRYFLCECDCGNIREVRFVAMRAGSTKSCGCFRNQQNPTVAITHGLSGTSLYHSWHSMKQRCLNPNNNNYRHYGGRGIKVCNEWIAFEPFLSWATVNGYKEGLTIERLDCNGNYEPSNCDWIPQNRQSYNTRNSKWINFNGKTQILKDWSIELGVGYKVLQSRLSRGWSVNKAFNLPLQTKYSHRKSL